MCRAALWALGGWRFVGEPPQPRRAVCLAVPHTDNLDGVLLVLLAGSAGMPITWMIKQEWTRAPVIGWLVRRAGGLGVDRSQRTGLVEAMVDELSRRDELHLVIPPEGTRSRAEYWKSGFYRIALGAGVPVVPGFLDYARKVGGFGEPIALTGDAEADMDRIREFYGDDAAAMARHPERFGPIRLREEDPAEDRAPA